MAKIKAGGIVWLRNYVHEQYPAAEGRLLSMLSAEELQHYKVTMTTSTVPLQSFVDIMTKAGKVLFPDDANGLRQLGRLQALHDLRGIYKVFMKIASITYLMERAAAVWRTYHEAGDATVEADPTQKNKAALVVKNYPDYYAPHAEHNAGYLEGLMELTGAKDVKVRTILVSTSEARWEATWR